MSLVQPSLRLLGLSEVAVPAVPGRSLEAPVTAHARKQAGTAIAIPPSPASSPTRARPGARPAPGVDERPSRKRERAPGGDDGERDGGQPGEERDGRRKDAESAAVPGCPKVQPNPAVSGAERAPAVMRLKTGKHVVILVENLPVPFDRRPWQIAQTLTGQGYQVSVICPRMYEYTAKYEQLLGIDIYRYPTPCEGNSLLGWVCEYVNALFWMTWLCLKLLFTRGIDSIHACNPPDLLFLVAWPFKVFAGVRFMFDHHDLNPEMYLAKFGRKDFLYRVMCAFERMTYHLADVALATNRSFKRIATIRDQKRDDRIYIVRNAPMAGRLIKGPQRDELRFGRRHLVSYLGVMNKQDGLDLLLESIADIVHRHKRSDVVFGLIGDGPEVPSLRRRAEQLGLNGEVKFLGRISDGRVISDYLNTATVCVCPDPKNEMNDHSTMTKVVEYMALGKPIVAYDLTESVYSAADAAVYATRNDPRQFADLIVKLLDDEPARKRMAADAKARYQAMLSWRRSQEQLLAAYARLFDPRSPLRPV
jgi:glycosyltransferase involved in cell wall biosynthesis